MVFTSMGLGGLEVTKYLTRYRFQVHEVAEGSPVALGFVVLTASGLTKLGDWRKVSNDGSASVVAAV